MVSDLRKDTALNGVAQLVGHSSTKQKVAIFIPSQGTCLGCRFDPWSGYLREATDQCFSPSLSPSLPLSLKINNYFLKRKILNDNAEIWRNVTMILTWMKCGKRGLRGSILLSFSPDSLLAPVPDLHSLSLCPPS